LSCHHKKTRQQVAGKDKAVTGDELSRPALFCFSRLYLFIRIPRRKTDIVFKKIAKNVFDPWHRQTPGALR